MLQCEACYNFRLLALFRTSSNGDQQLENKNQVCYYTTEIPDCGSGSWILVMKIDGNKVKIILN